MRLGEWRGALQILDGLDTPDLWEQTRLNVWRAKCFLHLSEPAKAFELVRQSSDTSFDQGPQLRDFARLILARSLTRLGEMPTALRLLARATKESPGCAPLRHLLADLVVNVLGDWPIADKVLQPLHGVAADARAIAAFAIKRQLYESSARPENLTKDIERFAAHHLAAPAEAIGHSLAHGSGAPSSTEPVRRQRLGLISPMFNASPVYFLSIGALQLLAQDFDLVFFARDCRSNWAEDAFRAIASEWHDVRAMPAFALTRKIADAKLHALIDLSGWLDLTVLEALASKPAPIQIKWVGGQSTTTGLRSFDAYVSDMHQSPASFRHLHSEPLAHLPNGYVTYTPPPYMPPPQAPSDANGPTKVGVVAHPKKLSRGFLAFLAQQMDLHNSRQGQAVEVQLIGWQYGEAALQRRLQVALGLDERHERGAVQVKYLASKSHQEHLCNIAATDWIVDTFPYTAGLTALEALALGIPYRTHSGQHTAARHAYSHARFAGLESNQIDLDALGVFQAGPLKKTGRSLLPDGCPRLDHAKLATDLARLIRNPSEYLVA